MPGRIAQSRKKFRRKTTAEKKPNQNIITLTGWPNRELHFSIPDELDNRETIPTFLSGKFASDFSASFARF